MVSLHNAGSIQASPNTYCFTSVINACAYCENDALEKRQALKIFVDTYKELTDRSDLRPNHVTFASILNALQTLLPEIDPKRTSAVMTVFKKCSEDGMCDQLVLKRLESLLDEEELRRLVGVDAVTPNGNVDISMIPFEWKRNVKSKASPRSKMMP